MEELNKWIFSLNELQMNNFLSVSTPFDNRKPSILCDKRFLNSKYFQHDVILIAETSNNEIAYELGYTSVNEDFLQIEYHEEDMELLLKQIKKKKL